MDIDSSVILSAAELNYVQLHYTWKTSLKQICFVFTRLKIWLLVKLLPSWKLRWKQYLQWLQAVFRLICLMHTLCCRFHFKWVKLTLLQINMHPVKIKSLIYKHIQKLNLVLCCSHCTAGWQRDYDLENTGQTHGQGKHGLSCRRLENFLWMCWYIFGHYRNPQ